VTTPWIGPVWWISKESAAGWDWPGFQRLVSATTVHVGHAISRLDPEEAQRTLEAFRELSQALGAADSEK